MKRIWILAVLAVLAMSACNTRKTFAPLDGEWDVVTIGEMLVPDSVGAFIGFDLAENMVYGATGCNRLTGSLPAEIGVPMFAALGSTHRMCADMAVEDAMLAALGAVVDFNLEGDSLYLSDADGNVVMTLVKNF